MIVGIHPDSNNLNRYSKKWKAFLEERGAEVRMLDLFGPDALKQAQGCDGVMWAWAHCPMDKQSAKRILYTIEHYLDIPVYPDSRTAWHYDEKVSQFYLLQALDAPIVPTWVFWHPDRAREWAETATYPVIFKLSCGAGSANVRMVSTKAEAARLIRLSFGRGIFPFTMNEFAQRGRIPRSREEIRALNWRLKDAVKYVWRKDYPALPYEHWRPEKGYIYFQEFVQDNDYDTRITVIGDRAFGFRRWNRPGDFRASGSGRIKHDPSQIDLEFVREAFRLSKRLGCQSMAYDFLYRKGKPVVVEISYTYLDSAVQQCEGHWTPDLDWVPGNMWPQEAQVEDFTKRIKERRRKKRNHTCTLAS